MRFVINKQIMGFFKTSFIFISSLKLHRSSKDLCAHSLIHFYNKHYCIKYHIQGGLKITGKITLLAYTHSVWGDR